MSALGVATGLLISALVASAPAMPLKSGQYRFEHRFAEQPSIPGIDLVATISGTHIALRNPGPAGVFPHGVIAEGQLAWHRASNRWIIVSSPTEANAIEVGGCSDGPEVIDLKRRIYWTC